MVSTLNPPAVVGFLHQDYRYISVASQIPYDAALILIENSPQTGDRTSVASLSTSSKLHALNRVTKRLGSNQRRIPEYEFKATCIKLCDQETGIPLIKNRDDYRLCRRYLSLRCP